jgi:hypothetical protein
MRLARKPHERRAPTIARQEVALDTRTLRRDLEAVEDRLESLDWGLRRQVRLLLGHVAAQRIGLHGPSGAFRVEVAKLSSGARVDISMAPPRDDAWSELVDPHVEHLAVRWGLDRRRPGGAWFEIGTAAERA